MMMNSLTNSAKSQSDTYGQSPKQTRSVTHSQADIEVDFDISQTQISVHNQSLQKQAYLRKDNELLHEIGLPTQTHQRVLAGERQADVQQKLQLCFDQDKWEKLRKMQEEVNKNLANYQFDDLETEAKDDMQLQLGKSAALKEEKHATPQETAQGHSLHQVD